MSSRTIRTTITRMGSGCFIPVTFDPREAFGRVRAPVTVTLNGYTYRSTISSMGGAYLIPLRKSHREAAGLEGGETLDVKIALDREVRDVEPPADLVKALKTAGVLERWSALSYTHRREHVEAIEEARKPETRARRIEKAVKMAVRADDRAEV